MKRLKELPFPILNQIIKYWILAVGTLFFSIALSMAYKDFSFLLTAFAISAGLTLFSFRITNKFHNGEYLRIQGTCQRIEYTTVRKQIKSITISVEEKDKTILLKLNTKKKRKSFWIGCRVEVFLDTKAAVSEKDGIHILSNHLTLSVIR
jgi:hypothetical protein